MLAPEIRCVVGIDVAKQAHMVCALQAPSGAVLRKPSRIEATTDGHAQLQGWLASWGRPDTIVLGMEEATGPLWEPLYDALTQAGYTVLLLNPRQTAAWATSLGLRAKTDELDAHTLACGLLAGLARASTLPDETVQALRTLTRARRGHGAISCRPTPQRGSGCMTTWSCSFPSSCACCRRCRGTPTCASRLSSTC